MASTQLQYLVGSTWTVENNLIRLSLTDSLHFPLVLEAVVGNPSNVREVVYKRYQEVRLIDLNSNRIIFYGKLEIVKPTYTGFYGETVTLTGRDNLQELLKNTINEDATYGNSTNRSAVIEDIINGGSSTQFSAHAWPGNISTSDTAKFKPSTTPSDELNKDLKKSSKNVLRTIEDLALDDPQDSPNAHFSGRDFLLDTTFNKVASDTSGVAAPALHYFSRGTVPTTPQTNGLTLEFQGTTAAQVAPALPDFGFPRASAEIVTKVRMEWVTPKTDPTEPQQQLEVECILINHGAPSSGAFVAGGVITWSSSKTAKIEKVIVDSADAAKCSLLISANGNDTWLDTISGQSISDGTRTATVNAVNATIPGSIREAIEQDVELVVKALEVEKKADVVDRAVRILQQNGDEIIRGNIKIAGWPTHKITDTHTGGASSTVLTDSGASFLNNGIRIGDEVVNVTDSVTGLITGVTATTITTSGTPDMSWANGNTYEVYVPNRAGHVVYTKGFPVSDIGDQNALITRIAFEEGPGIQNSSIDIVLHVTGHAGEGLPRRNQTRTNNSTEDANFASPGLAGTRDISTLSWSYTGAFSTPTAHQVDWSGGTLKLSDGREFTIAGGNSGTIPSSSPFTEYLYFDIDTPTIFVSTPTMADVMGIDTVFIAKFTRSSTSVNASYIAYGTMSTALELNIESGNKVFNTAYNSPPTANAAKDLWLTSDTNQLFIATAEGDNEILPNEWVLRDDADAINNAETSIEGGLIKTQRIKLLKGGSLNVADAGNAFETTASTAVTTSRRLNGAVASTSATTLTIDAHTTSDTLRVLTSGIADLITTTFNVDTQSGSELSIAVGDIVKVDTEEMLVIAAVTGDTVFTVSRGWRSTTAATHNSGAAVHKYTGQFIMAGDVIRLGTEDMFVISANAAVTELEVERGWNRTVTATYADDTMINKYVMSMVGISDPHIILDNHGITGYSDAFTPEFSLKSTTGQGVFGNGSVTLGNSGITFGTADQSQIITWLHSVGGGATYLTRANTSSGMNNGKHLLFQRSGGTTAAETAILFFMDLGTSSFVIPHIYADDITFDGALTGGGVALTALYGGVNSNADSLHTHPLKGDIDSVNITAGVHLTGNVNTQSGNHIQTIDHIEGAGSNHIPALGGTGQILVNNGSGSAAWAAYPDTLPGGGTSESYGSRQVLTYIDSGAYWAVPGAHGVHNRVNDGSTNTFAYYSGTTALSAATSSGSITLYCNNINSLGSSLYYGGMTSGVARDVQLSVGGYMYYDGSSRRYKENIVELAVDSSKIYELVPKSFKMKDMQHPTITDNGTEDYDNMITEIGATTFGLIAEEVHEVLPELVIYNEDNEPDAVRYKTISVLLIEEMKKLRARIEVLEGN